MTMIKKIVTITTLLAASATLASAASVAYTFSNADTTQASGATNVKVTSGPTSLDNTTTNLGGTFTGASLVISAKGGEKKLFANAADAISGSNVGTTALDLLKSVNSSLDSVSGITLGLQNGSGSTSAYVSFAATGLTANTGYTVSFLVKAASTSSNITLENGSFVEGSYVTGTESTTNSISLTDTSFVLASTTETAVLLKVTTDDSGAFTIKFQNANNAKTTIGYFGISDSAIPEPSAFSLLAGVGALALTVARRRRRSR